MLAAVVYLPLLLTKPGKVGADTKTYLYLDPSRMLSRAPDMWDQHIGLGTVTHQNIGYLWPIGPWYWLADAVGLPDWVAQRLWLGTILFLAGLGVRFMLKAMGQEGPQVTAATFCYALTPYVLTLAARLSVILLPFAGLPWLIGLTVLALRRQRWREPALFALVIATIGSVNATALILVCAGPILWLLCEVFVLREARFRDAITAGLRISVITIACSLWWLSGLWAQGRYGIQILRFTETAETVAAASVSLEVLRGLGYWFFYGDDRYGPWITPSRWYTVKVPLLAFSFVLPGLGLIGAAVARFRDRAFFLLLFVVGLILAVGAHPWNDGAPVPRLIRAVLESDAGLSMRSLPRAAPLVVLALSVFVGSLIAAIAVRHERWARPLTAVVVLFAILNLPPLWTGRLVDVNLDRDEKIPSYWDEAARYLDAQGDATRVLEVPGSDFASYRWGNTVDPILPGLMDRPYVARELIPYGSPPSADLLNSFDRRLQELTYQSASLAPIARFMGVGNVSVRSDLTYERYNTPRPKTLWNSLITSPGVKVDAGFGPTTVDPPRDDLPLRDEIELTTDPNLASPPKVGILGIDQPEDIVRTAPIDGSVIVAGSGDGLVDLAGAGLLSGHELVRYSGSFVDDAAALRTQAAQGATLVVTDTNRRQGNRWGTVRDNLGYTERADETPLVVDPADQRLDIFDTDDPDTQTVTVIRGGVSARASSYGNVVSLTAEDRPDNAVDGDIHTAWRTGGFADAQGEKLELHFTKPVTADQVRVLQAIGGVRNRTITDVSVRLDDGDPIPFHLDDSSRPDDPTEDEAATAGQVLHFAQTTFQTLTITIDKTDPSNLRRFEGISGVGFAEVAVTGADGKELVADETVRPPTDLLDTLGAASLDHPLVFNLTRLRTASAIAVRNSPEKNLERQLSVPTARSFTLSGQVRLTDAAVTDAVLDGALGIADQTEGGVTATSTRRLPGGNANRAMAAIDGDPTTWWSPGFLDQHGDAMTFKSAKPVTVSRLDISVLNDGRHSVPRLLDVSVGDGYGTPVTQRVDLGEIPDQTTPNGHATVSVTLPKAVTGSDITVSIPRQPLSSVRDVWTRDYFSGAMVPMPVGIVDLGIAGLRAPAMASRIDDRCRTNLLTVDGKKVGVTISGTTADALAGKPLRIATCDDEPIDLTAGTHELSTAQGSIVGFDLDGLVLRSAAGGAADTATGPVGTQSTVGDGRPDVTVDARGATSVDLTVTGADDRFWLVLGQSYNLGWHATADGKDLGAPQLVNGYANGWQVPAGDTIHVQLRWTPQKVVWASIWASLAAVVVALVLVLRPQRQRAGADAFVPLDARPSMPQAANWRRLTRYAGPTPGRFAQVATVGFAGLFGFLVIGPIPGVVVTLAALATIRFPRARPVLTIGGPLLFAACVAYVVGHQLLDPIPGGFDWPQYYRHLDQPAWTAAALVALDVVVDRCWLRRWWPTADSPD